MQNKRQTGFTIVELLIVIVVIGILSTIMVAVYSGVQNRAHDSAIQSDLKNIARALSSFYTVKGAYPTEAEIMTINQLTDVAEAKIKVSLNAYDITTLASSIDLNMRNILICVRNGADPKYGVIALSKSGNTFMYTSSNGLQKDTNTWVAQQGVLCPRMGIATTDPGYARSFGYQRQETATPDSGWRDWAKGL